MGIVIKKGNRMKNLLLSTVLVLFLVSLAAAQDPTPGYYLIYGNRDGSPIDVNIDSDIEIKVWAATPAIGSGNEDLDGNGVVDSIEIMHSPLASNDSIITSRDGGEFFYPLTAWDDVAFFQPNPDATFGFTNQSLLCFTLAHISGLNTDGDTIHIATFFMRTASDTSLILDTVCPFIEGYHPVQGGLIWLFQGGMFDIFPSQTFSCLDFVDYLPGDANSSGAVNGLDVTYLLSYFKSIGPPPDPMLAGDANGDCMVNGLDVIYLVSYLKGGLEPLLGDCH